VLAVTALAVSIRAGPRRRRWGGEEAGVEIGDEAAEVVVEAMFGARDEASLVELAGEGAGVGVLGDVEGDEEHGGE